ncbi:Leucine rich repeat-containing protein [Eubacterium uniforme]|uniref:Leucine rich repeat-containing protein n=1 Tax=Eubacterium uniforme TaxID=39495 RepID=A0A1T4VVY2_9FIRM|nr:leucine-rich repeat domain-containing protein [Eubacterium uniforme]SKA68641.1 Leucine rich repeat-containing protein [Eubacterium uniforme]
MKKIKRFLATMLTFVLVFDMCKVSEVSAFDNNDNYTGLAITGAQWADKGYASFESNKEWYSREFWVDVHRDEVFSLANFNEGFVNPLAGDTQIKIMDGNNHNVTDDVEWFKGYIRYDDQAQHDVLVDNVSGLYTFRFDHVGDYFIKIGDEENEYVTIHVELPDVALYKANELSEDNLVAISDINYFYNNGEKLYLMFKNGFADREINREDLIDAYVQFGPQLKKEKIDLVETQCEPIEITIPETLVGEYRSAIVVVLEYVDDNPNNPDNMRRMEYHFHFDGEQDGLVVSDANWGPNGLEARTENQYENYEDFIRDYGKTQGAGLKDINHKCLGIKSYDELQDKEIINLLGEEDMDNISIMDEDGNLVDGDVVSFAPAVASRWDEATQQDVEYFPANVFEFHFNTCGTFIIRYDNGKIKSQVKIDVGIPEVSTYVKKSAEERYCVGNQPLFNNDRNTFYVITTGYMDEWFERQINITGVEANSNIDMNTVSVETDYDNNVVKVSIKEDCDRGFGLRVFYNIVEIEYDGEGKEVNRREDFRDQEVWFNYENGELTYDEETAEIIDAVDAFEDMVNKLPEAKYVTLDDKADILAANEYFDAMTEDQMTIVEIAVVEKLTAVNEALGDLLDEEAVINQKKADAEVVNSAINALPPKDAIKITDKEAVEAARAAYDALDAEVKIYVTKEAYAKLVEAEAMIEKAQIDEMLIAANAANGNLQEQKKAAEEAKAKSDAQVTQLQTENSKLVAENKKYKEEGSGKQEVKPATVKVSDIITDKASKAKYKVLSVGTDDAMGTVEFVESLNTNNTKYIVPSTITSKGVTYAVTRIGDGAFKDNKKLKSVVISEGITYIGVEAFAGCKKLKNITVNTTVLKKVGKNALKDVAKKCVIKVPGTKFKKYKKVIKKKGQGKKVKVKKI